MLNLFGRSFKPVVTRWVLLYHEDVPIVYVVETSEEFKGLNEGWNHLDFPSLYPCCLSISWIRVEDQNGTADYNSGLTGGMYRVRIISRILCAYFSTSIHCLENFRSLLLQTPRYFSRLVVGIWLHKCVISL